MVKVGVMREFYEIPTELYERAIAPTKNPYVMPGPPGLSKDAVSLGANWYLDDRECDICQDGQSKPCLVYKEHDMGFLAAICKKHSLGER